ncbi:hypothetical protein A2U01_0115022 [Trifolium medium]|uniref:Uncharacterized protein n=1 Tax=Trifolium medium TaxID=97028 RepID=A0A392VZ94_9FABA|nr:hypothetical protein [Trifolium medium]
MMRCLTNLDLFKLFDGAHSSVLEFIPRIKICGVDLVDSVLHCSVVG